MSIAFRETQLDDGYVQITWTCDTQREFQRVLRSMKTMIPKEYRTWVPSQKAWTIAPDAMQTYEAIKEATEADENNSGEMLGRIHDDAITDDAMLNMINDKLSKLPNTMKRKALFAIHAAMGRIDAPVEFSLSKSLFGAWNEEHGHWFYEDGRYSSWSPSDWDDKQLSTAHRRMRVADEQLDSFLDGIDQIPYEQEKRLFRLDMLEKYEYKCYVCEARPPDLRGLHMHRVLPGNLGGQYIESNVVILCRSCHRIYEGECWDSIKAARRQHRYTGGEYGHLVES